MNPKYQIFISSTYEDLKEEREAVIKTILRLGHIPIGMEMFNAANETQWEMIKRRIEESDYYVIIIAHRYGSIDEDSGISYTEKEYLYAKSLGIPVLAFTIDRRAAWPGDRREENHQKQVALSNFVNEVQKKMRATWSNKDELASAVSLALNETIVAFPRIGWIRANQAANPEMANELVRLIKENADFREKLANIETTSYSPEFEVNALIKWECWGAERGFGASTNEVEEGYRLYLRLKNIGNLISESSLATAQFPASILVGHELYTSNTLDGSYSLEIGKGEVFYSNEAYKGISHVLHPGTYKQKFYEITTESVEVQTDWKIMYSIHPDQGREIQGEIPFNKIEVRKRNSD